MSKAFIILGRSGCGKDTQIELLAEKFRDLHQEPMVIATGDLFRAFAREGGHTAEKVKESLARGELLPDFLAIKLWGEQLVHEMPKDVLFFNGAPRTELEAAIIDGALSFYGIQERFVIYLTLSVPSSEERLRKRSRADDLTPAARARRLHWFDTDAVGALRFFQSRGGYHVLEVDGEPPIDVIHKDIVSKLGLRKQW